MNPFVLSIEPTEGESFKHGFHLGTDERLAREIAEEIFRDRKWWPGKGRITVRTVALMLDGKIVDVFDGQWESDRANAMFDDMALDQEDGEPLSECDCCGRQKANCATVWTSGLETYACPQCRGLGE